MAMLPGMMGGFGPAAGAMGSAGASQVGAAGAGGMSPQTLMMAANIGLNFLQQQEQAENVEEANRQNQRNSAINNLIRAAGGQGVAAPPQVATVPSPNISQPISQLAQTMQNQQALRGRERDSASQRSANSALEELRRAQAEAVREGRGTSGRSSTRRGSTTITPQQTQELYRLLGYEPLAG